MAPQAQAASVLMKQLDHPVRLTIASLLLEGECPVSALEAALGIRQPALSQQLAALREAGIVAARREVKQVFYRLVDPRAAELVMTLQRLFGEAAPAAADAPPACPPRWMPPASPSETGRSGVEAARFARLTPPQAGPAARGGPDRRS